MAINNIKGIIFDMDNTLFDLVEAKMVACTEIITFLGTGDPDKLFGYFRRGIHGFENPENIKDYMTDSGINSTETYRRCVTIYKTEKVKHIRLYPMVRETLEELKEMGLHLGILTDANSNNAWTRLEKVGMEKLFHSLISHDMTGAKKPDHTPFRYALETMGLEAHETLFVGDSLRRDIAPSKELGMMTVYAAYGDRNSASDRIRAEYGPDHIIHNFSEILELVRRHGKDERI